MPHPTDKASPVRRLRRAWDALPASWRRQAHLGAASAAAAVRPIRVGLGWRRGNAGGPPVHVAGMFADASGVGRSARMLADALEAVGVETVRLAVPGSISQRAELDPGLAGQDDGRPGLLVSQLNPPELMRWLDGDGARALRNRRHVGYWFWELPDAPPSWRGALRYVDEVWCQSRFTQGAVAGIDGRGPPVRVLAHPLFVVGRPDPARARFGLEHAGCVVLASADLRSTSARKNPLGALEAFLRAAPRPDPGRAVLVCKVSGLDVEPRAAARLRAAAAERPDVRLIEEALSDLDMARLVASSDVVLSLHRSEGFGLVPAEALWMGRAVVATGWSGVLDFLDADCAELVDHRLTPVEDAQGIYVGGLWAEPDLADAASRLARLIDDPDRRRLLSQRGRARAEALFSRDAWLAQAAPLLGLDGGA